ncbi:hypothetical protein ScPMuIL_006127 [Solemya velum]
MKFHSTHGSAVFLSDNQCSATKNETIFSNGIVFSDQPLPIGQKAVVELGCSFASSGSIRVGVTIHDPSKLKSHDLPKYVVPFLTCREGYWARPISENLVTSGSRLMLYITSLGQLQLFIDDNHRGVYLGGLPVDKPLWLLFDIYGNTKSVKFVKPVDDVHKPKEIVARGTEAVRAYEEACKFGTRPVYHTRLMLIGQDGVGKTSLKNALVGERHNENEEKTDGIDLSTCCSFHLNGRTKWQMSVVVEEDLDEPDNRKSGLLGNPDNLEEEYNRALATNIVQELLSQQRQKETTPPIPGSRTRTSVGSKDGSRDKDRRRRQSLPTTSSTDVRANSLPVELIGEVPDPVVQLVQEMLNEISTNDNKDASTKSRSTPAPIVSLPRVVLNIWDFAGRAVYYTTHQVFLTHRAVYIIVFNLTHDLNINRTTEDSDSEEDDVSVLACLDFWLRCIHAHASENAQSSIENTRLSPPIFIVGTHQNSLDPDPVIRQEKVEEKFEAIRSFIIGKPYVHHVVTPFFAVENNLDNNQEDDEIGMLRETIENTVAKEIYMGEKMPIKWLRFEKQLAHLVKDGSNYATFDQIKEISANIGISDDSEVKTMLNFYHDLGILIYYGGSGILDNVLRNTVILQPQWLIDIFRKVITGKGDKSQWDLLKDKWQVFEDFGILHESLLNVMWQDYLEQKQVLLGLMEKFDLICERLPQLSDSETIYSKERMFYVPSHLAAYKHSDKRLYVAKETDTVFYIDFHGFLPEGLFHRILTRTVRWTQEQENKQPYSMFSRVTRFYLDAEHDFVLEMMPKLFNRIKVVVLRVAEPSGADEDQVEEPTEYPNPVSCAKIKNFLESAVLDLKETWMKRISYRFCVECPCGRTCSLHNKDHCVDKKCLHFLDLDECLTNRVVCCEHRRVKTSAICKCFPTPEYQGFSDPVLPPFSLEDTCGNIEKHSTKLPEWIKGAAKLLNGGAENQDWLALAKHLGYKNAQIEKLCDDLNPGLALIADWIITSGNTPLSVDTLCVYLEKIERDDVIELIHRARETNVEPPHVFISYQWDSQTEVKSMRDKLERVGFSCWMDIGQMGGGDQLNMRIEEGIRNSKVVIACLSPKYIVSHHCNQELSLADLLNKTIIPVVFDPIPWPPPGGMALIFSQLVYINMKGIGGHGGTGMHADLEDKYREVIQRVLLHATPDMNKCIDTENLLNSEVKYPVSSQEHCTSDSSEESLPGETTYFVDPFSLRESIPTDIRNPFSDDGMRSRRSEAVERVHVSKCAVCVIL